MVALGGQTVARMMMIGQALAKGATRGTKNKARSPRSPATSRQWHACWGTPEAVKEGRVQAAYEQHQARIRALDENEG